MCWRGPFPENGCHSSSDASQHLCLHAWSLATCSFTTVHDVFTAATILQQEPAAAAVMRCDSSSYARSAGCMLLQWAFCKGLSLGMAQCYRSACVYMLAQDASAQHTKCIMSLHLQCFLNVPMSATGSRTAFYSMPCFLTRVTRLEALPKP